MIPGLKHCERCREIARRSQSVYKAKAKASGRCVRHPRQPARPGRVTCQLCTDQRRVSEAARTPADRRAAYRRRKGGAVERPKPKPTRDRPKPDAGILYGLKGGYKATTQRMPTRDRDEFKRFRLDSVADGVARVLRLMLSEGRDLDDVEPAEVLERFSGPHRPFASEAGALVRMYLGQWATREQAKRHRA